MELNLIKIEVLPQPMDEQFDEKMDAAYKQAAIAGAAYDLLEALELLLDGAEKCKVTNQPQLNGGKVLAKAALAKARGE